MFIVVDISVEGEIHGYLELTDMNSSDLTTETGNEAVVQDKGPTPHVESDSLIESEMLYRRRHLLFL